MAGQLDNLGGATSTPGTTPPSETPAQDPAMDSPTPESSAQDTVMSSPTPDTPAQSGIFSSSDTRIETENLPAIQPTPMSTAPAGAITPTTRTESTVDGDLKLGSDGRKRKKWWIPVIAILVVVMLILGGWALLTAGNGDSNVDDEAKKALNHFSNYYLYGTDSSEPISSEYDSNVAYKVVTATEDGDTDFFKKAKEYYDTFLQTYEKKIRHVNKISDSDNIDEYIDGNVASFSQMFDFIYRCGLAPALTSEDIFGVFANVGTDSAQKFVSDHYADLLNSTYEPGVRYAKERMTYDLAQVDQFRIYRDNNCMDGESLKSNCDIDLNKYDTTRIEEAAQIANSDILQLPSEIVDDSIEQLFLIQKDQL